MKDFATQERAVDAYRNSRTRTLVFCTPGRPNLGVQNNEIRFPYPGKVVECYANVRNAPVELPVEIMIEKCSQENIDGTPQWVPVLTTGMTIDVGKKSTKNAAVPYVIGDSNVNVNDHFRVNITQLDVNIIDLTVEVVILLK